jgi:hypothetical protein
MSHRSLELWKEGFLMSAIRLTIWSARLLGVGTAILGWLFLTADSSIVTWIARVPGVGTQILGWLHWIANSSSFIFTHMVLGITFALLLLALSLIQLLTGRMRLLGASGIVYTLILTALGFTQTGLLVGPMHWLIQTAHVVIGFGALVLVQVISVRDARLRRSEALVPVPRAMAPQAVR